MSLLEAEIVRSKLHNEHLERQRITSRDLHTEAKGKSREVFGSGKPRRKENARNSRGSHILEGSICQVGMVCQQAIMDISRSLFAVEGMVYPLNTPVEIMQFLELCNSLKAKLSASQHWYATCSKSKVMENKVEALE
ncbi:hypothetical protein CR513_33676, partial [Mucuna pruriens]